MLSSFKLKTILPQRDLVPLTWLLWGVACLVLCGVSYANGFQRSVTGSYAGAARHWRDGLSLYAGGKNGFLYLPTCAVLYQPFDPVPRTVGEILWRVVNIGAYALGVFKLSRLGSSLNRRELFPLASILTLPLMLSCGRNGQMNLVLSGLAMIAAHELANRRYWRSSLFLVLGFALKPLLIVVLLLVLAIYLRKMGLPIIVFSIVFILFPFLTQNSDYVLSQYLDYPRKVYAAGTPDPRLFLGRDVFGITLGFGYVTPVLVRISLCITMAVFTLYLCWIGRKRYGEYIGPYIMVICGLLYLVLFNPRTEGNSYAIVAPFLALAASWLLLLGKDRKIGVVLILGIAGIALNSPLTAWWSVNATWLPPTVVLVFAILVATYVVKGVDPFMESASRKGVRKPRELMLSGAATNGRKDAEQEPQIRD